MSSRVSEHQPLLLTPFVALWHLLTAILGLTGRLIALVLGIVLVVVGALLSITVIGSVVGVPLVAIGSLLVLRALF